MLNTTTVTLPSFLRRVMKAYELKAKIRALGCDLHRIGRSRNWQLKAEREQIFNIITLIDEANEPSWLWLAKLLRSKNEALSLDELMQIAQKNPSITINNLIAKTQCTLVQARKVIDLLEGLE